MSDYQPILRASTVFPTEADVKRGEEIAAVVKRMIPAAVRVRCEWDRRFASPGNPYWFLIVEWMLGSEKYVWQDIIDGDPDRARLELEAEAAIESVARAVAGDLSKFTAVGYETADKEIPDAKPHDQGTSEARGPQSP